MDNNFYCVLDHLNIILLPKTTNKQHGTVYICLEPSLLDGVLGKIYRTVKKLAVILSFTFGVKSEDHIHIEICCHKM